MWATCVVMHVCICFDTGLVAYFYKYTQCTHTCTHVYVCLPLTADREVQRILLELLNQMDGFDQSVNVKVTCCA